MQGRGDALACLAVAVGVVRAGHGAVGAGIAQQLVRLRHDAVGIGADELDRARGHRLGALGGVAHHQHRLAQRRGLLLDAAGIGQDQGAAVHQVDERQVVLRLDEVDIANLAQQAAHRLLYLRVQVHRIDHVQLRMLAGNACQRGADALEAGAEVLAPVPGHQHHAPGRVEKGEALGQALAQLRVAANAPLHLQQCIDHRVAGDMDGLGRDALGQQVAARRGGGCEMPARQGAGELAVGLLGPGRIQVAGAQAGLDMANRNALVEGRQRCRQRGGGIAVHQHRVGPPAREHGAHAGEHAGGDVGQVLPGLHQIEVELGLDPEQAEHLVEHLPVLRGDADPGVEARQCLQLLDQRRHLDGLGPGAEYQEYLHGGFRKLLKTIAICAYQSIDS